MHLRRALLLDRWIQLGLMLVVVVLANMLAARHFTRLDLTAQRIYTLSDATRRLVGRLDKPLYVKVFFTEDLDPPYNNHERILVDKLEEFRAYSRGHMELTVVDPSHSQVAAEEARSFGIESIPYTYRGHDRSELKRVYMGVSFVYGERQAAMDAVTQVGTIEYDIARVIVRLLADEQPPVVGFTAGHGEVDMARKGGPEEKLLQKLGESHRVMQVPLGGEEGVPDEVGALLMLGPQRQVSERAKYQMDQFLMRGGALAVFISNYLPDTRNMRTQEIYTGLEGLLGQYGVVVNRDLVLDRANNGRMAFPVRQGRRVVQVLVNTPLIPKVTHLSQNSLIVKDLDQMLFPFTSSLTLVDPLPSGVQAELLATADPEATRLKGVRHIDPAVFNQQDPGEHKGAWPLLAALTGTFTSAYAERPIPPPASDTPFGDVALASDDPASKITESAPARLVVGGSHQMVLNNIAFMLNMVDWMCEDVDLIGIRSKTIQIPPLEQADESRRPWIKLANLLIPVLLLFLVGGLRWLLRRKHSTRLEVS